MDKAKLKEIRHEIDEVDQQLINLLKNRINLSLQAKDVKKAAQLEIQDIEREQEIIKQLSQLPAEKSAPLTEFAIKRIFAAIIKECRDIQLVENSED